MPLLVATVVLTHNIIVATRSRPSCMPWARSTQLGRTQAHLLHTPIYSSRAHTHTHTSAVVDSVIIALASSQRRQHHVRSTTSSLSSNASTCMSPPPLPPPTAACSADTDPSEPPAPPPPRPRALRAPGTTQTTCTNRRMFCCQ